MATTEHTSVAVHPEDRELLKKLSSLQDINKQVGLSLLITIPVHRRSRTMDYRGSYLVDLRAPNAASREAHQPNKSAY